MHVNTMILFHFRSSSGPRPAIRTETEAFEAGISLSDFISGAHPTRGVLIDLSTVRFAPAVPRPGKILCIGLNYRQHAEETGAETPKHPIVFSKLGNTIAASGDEIPLPTLAHEYDYEAELVVVIGRTARNVSERHALDHVWGYCNGNDISARDLQRQSSQWLLGKTLHSFAPIGPWIVSRDEAGELDDMPVRCTVNSELRQSSTAGDMIFGVPEIVRFVSRHFALDPGDVIFTGTPQGVALGRPDHPWLKPGDEVTVEVGNLGRLTNRMVAAP